MWLTKSEHKAALSPRSLGQELRTDHFPSTSNLYTLVSYNYFPRQCQTQFHCGFPPWLFKITQLWWTPGNSDVTFKPCSRKRSLSMMAQSQNASNQCDHGILLFQSLAQGVTPVGIKNIKVRFLCKQSSKVQNDPSINLLPCLLYCPPEICRGTKVFSFCLSKKTAKCERTYMASPSPSLGYVLSWCPKHFTLDSHEYMCFGGCQCKHVLHTINART